MTKRILIIGGYGNFGSYITRSLAREEDIQVIIAGRSEVKCKNFIQNLSVSGHPVEYYAFDITKEIPLNKIRPDIVIHTSGPFQEQGYAVAEACIDFGCHYLDLADGRQFVSNIKNLDRQAVKADVAIISGASSVPALSSAVLDKHQTEFTTLRELDYGIATAQQTNRGLATTSAILGYTGKVFQTLIEGKMTNIYGWQDLHFRSFPEFGRRGLCNCDIPDLSLFPDHYPELETIRFHAGTEISFMHVGLWLMSWLVRWKLINSLRPAAGLFLKIARFFDSLGSGNSAFYMKIIGLDRDGKNKEKTIYILASDGDGPHIPCVPAIILAKRMVRENGMRKGAYPCVGLIDLDSYLSELQGLNINLLEV